MKTGYIFLFLALALASSVLYGQSYSDYIGAGHSTGIIITASDNHQLYQGINTASGDKTLGGQGLVGKQMEASRFLSQATFGADLDLINEVADLGIENWMDQQFLAPATYYTDTIQSIFDKSRAIYIANGNDSTNYPTRPNHVHMDYAWWQNNMLAKDLLRQRVAYSLSQITVIS